MLIDQLVNKSVGIIKVSKLSVISTYSWLLAGIPTKEMNRKYIKSIKKDIYKRYKEVPLFLGSKVRRLEYDSDYSDTDLEENEMKEVLAPYTCIMKLTCPWSYLKSDSSFTESSLWVFWCQETIPWPQNEKASISKLEVTFSSNAVLLNIDEKMISKINKIDWKKVSSSYDNTP